MTVETISELRELVSYVLKDRGNNDDRLGQITFNDTEIDQEITSCVNQFSQDIPNVATVDIVGTGSRYYKLTTLDGWVNHYSTIQSIEYPAIDPDEVEQTSSPTFLNTDEFSGDIKRYRNGLDDYIVTQGFTPSASETLRIQFTTPYVLTEDSDDCTIPATSIDAVGYLVASRLCRRMAAFTANSADATINSVAGEFRQSNLAWIKAAEEFENQYRTHVGLPLVHNGRVQTRVAAVPAERNANWNTYPHAGRDWFTYPNSRR